MPADDLDTLQQMLRTAGVRAQRHEPGAGNPVGQLALDGGTDERGRPRTLSLAFLPVPPDAGSQARLLQFYAQLPFRVPPARLAEAQQLILHINNLLPFMGFGCIAGAGVVYFRYTLMMRRDELPFALVQEALHPITFFISHFGAEIERVADGRQSAAQAIARLGDDNVPGL